MTGAGIAMGKFSGRQTDSRGWTKIRDANGDWHGVPPLLGTPKYGKNKGVMVAYRKKKREEAEQRMIEHGGTGE